MKKLDEEEQREEYLEAIGDVKKQGNLDGFYRHLYDQKVLYEDKIDAEEETNKPTLKEESEEEKINKIENNDKSKNKVNQKKRKYRKRDESSESEPSTPQREAERNLQHLPSNIDADSDFSIDSSDTDEENEVKKARVAQEEEKNDVKETVETKADEKNDQRVENEDDSKVCDKKEENEEVKVVKPKINIWKKRTVGAVFDEALKRYFERKASREAGTYVRPTL